MKTVKRILLFIGLKIIEIGGGLVLLGGFVLGLIWLIDNMIWLYFILTGAMLSTFILIPLCCANWEYVKRKIK